MSAYVDLGRHALCSASPELFFRLEGDQIVSRPMKGTAARGRTLKEDEGQAAWLRQSVKNQAENLMIVDMVRNDLGRIAHPGTVRVPRLFELEKYPTLYQLTSTVAARTDASLEEIFAALFPCASITGAPKIRTMHLIRRLEKQPRGIYTGAIGWVGPGRRACFSVAIRTVQIERAAGTATYGTGAGIVWDSEAETEYRECLTKAQLLTRSPDEFSLLETLRWDSEGGFALLERHLQRLRDSARYFDYRYRRDEVTVQLLGLSERLPPAPHRVRLLLRSDGEVRLESEPLSQKPPSWRVAIAGSTLDRNDPFLFHKTTRRAVYDKARAEFPALDDVILCNQEDELTESTMANLVLKIGGELLTPPIDCGLLPGTRRAELLAKGRLREAVLPRAALLEAEEVWLINSVRGWIRAELEIMSRSPSPPVRPETLTARLP